MNNERFLINFIFETGDSKHCILTIFFFLQGFRVSRTRNTQMVGTIRESAYNNTALFFSSSLDEFSSLK